MFKYVATAAFIAGSYAAPTYLNPISREECDPIACGVAAGPTGVGCVSAAVKLGADPFADAGCVAGLVNLGVNLPGSCQPCVDKLKEEAPGFIEDATDAISDVVEDGKDFFKSLFSREECDAVKCGIAAGPTGVGCVSAAVKLGADPFADAGCVAGLVNLGVNTPDVCQPCIDKAKEKIPELFEDVPEFFEDVGDVASGVVDNVKDTFSSLFGRESCDIVKCAAAAGPTGVGCVSAAAKLGADPFADAGCVAGLLNLGVNVPGPCQPCLEAAKDKVPEVFEDVPGFFEDIKDTASDVFDDAIDGIGSIF